MHTNKPRLKSALFAVCLIASACSYSAKTHGATVQIINQNAAGIGFNDTTTATPVGGNTGTTLGQQRMIAFQYAANIWGSLLQSTVPIRVGAQFTALSCTASSGTLGSAGPTYVQRDFANAPHANTWYPVALANAIAATDLTPSEPHINANFSSTIGTPGCLQNSGWYFGLDKNPPSGKIDFVSVLIHELAHGLGVVSMVNLGTGEKFNGRDDTYMRNLEHHSASPSAYPSMNNTQRLAASTSTGNLHWIGANVRAASGMLSSGKVGDHVRMFAPSPAQGGSSVSHWDTALTPNQIMEPSYTEPIHAPELELALFKDIGWTVAPSSNFMLSVTKTGAGTITSVPAGINCGSNCSASYPSGAAVNLTATPNTGYTRTAWGGACAGVTSNVCTVTMNGAKSASATFTQTHAEVLLVKAGQGNGTITTNIPGFTCGSGTLSCQTFVANGSTVSLTPSPAAGSVFSGWGGSNCTGTGNCTFTVNATTTISAVFNPSGGSPFVTPLTQTNLSGAADSTKNYSVVIPSGAKNLLIQTRGGTGDIDLYVKFGQAPTTSNWDCRSYATGNEEQCTFPTPSAGTYHIMLHGYSAYAQGTLTVTYEGPSSGNPSSDIMNVINLLLLN